MAIGLWLYSHLSCSQNRWKHMKWICYSIHTSSPKQMPNWIATVPCSCTPKPSASETWKTYTQNSYHQIHVFHCYGCSPTLPDPFLDVGRGRGHHNDWCCWGHPRGGRLGAVVVTASEVALGLHGKCTYIFPSWEQEGLYTDMKCLCNTSTHACAHAHMHTCTHTYTYTHAHTHTHIHTQLLTHCVNCMCIWLYANVLPRYAEHTPIGCRFPSSCQDPMNTSSYPFRTYSFHSLCHVNSYKYG